MLSQHRVGSLVVLQFQKIAFTDFQVAHTPKSAMCFGIRETLVTLLVKHSSQWSFYDNNKDLSAKTRDAARRVRTVAFRDTIFFVDTNSPYSENGSP